MINQFIINVCSLTTDAEKKTKPGDMNLMLCSPLLDGSEAKRKYTSECHWLEDMTAGDGTVFKFSLLH